MGGRMFAKKEISALKLILGMLMVAVLAACSVEVDSDDGNKSTPINTPKTNAPKVEESAISTKTFWALDLTTTSFYQLTADLLAEGSYCKVWVEQESQKYCDSSTAQKIAAEYDNKIYGKMLNAFNVITEGTEVLNDTSNDTYIDNIMEAADWMADGDGKLCILMLNIKDGFTRQNGSYTAGYFYSIDLLKNDPKYPKIHSNETDMIYLDTYPAVPGGTESYQTLAHEMQHLMNYVTTSAVRHDEKGISQMDLWIDEGLSSAAEYIYLDDHVTQRYEWFNNDSRGTIALGNNFFVWGNLNDASVLDDYATVYLFFQWLRLQSGGGTEIYKDIIKSPEHNYLAVAEAAYSKIGWFKEKVGDLNDNQTALLESSWSILFEPWLAANYINSSTGQYGYNNDEALKNIKAKTAPAGITDLQLLPGEAVYSTTISSGTTSSYTNGSGNNIKYVGLKKNGGDVNVSSDNTYEGGALLTYNSNTVNSSPTKLDLLKETGNLTGEADTVTIAANSLSIAGTDTAKPVRIDARDMLARNGWTDEVLNAALMLKSAVFNVRGGVE